MKISTKTRTIEIDGIFLRSSFSIYLVEIIAKGGPYYYAGMTGDNHYSSARAGIDRLGKHFETIKSSTQNRIYRALKTRNLEVKKIRMHYWPIEGFDANYWEKVSSVDKKSIPYNEYKTAQKNILTLEQEIISAIGLKTKTRCLNTAKKKNISSTQNNRKFISQVLELVK